MTIQEHIKLTKVANEIGVEIIKEDGSFTPVMTAILNKNMEKMCVSNEELNYDESLEIIKQFKPC